MSDIERINKLFANALSSDKDSVFRRPEAKGLYYNSKKILIDGYKFVECRFDNCTLTAHTTSFEFYDCVFDSDTTVELGAELRKVIQLHNQLGHDVEASDLYNATVSERGAVTISEIV